MSPLCRIARRSAIRLSSVTCSDVIRPSAVNSIVTDHDDVSCIPLEHKLLSEAPRVDLVLPSALKPPQSNLGLGPRRPEPPPLGARRMNRGAASTAILPARYRPKERTNSLIKLTTSLGSMPGAINEIKTIRPIPKGCAPEENGAEE